MHHLLPYLGEIVCHFFEGLHNEYETPVSEDFHEVMRIHGSHAYLQGDPSRFENLRQGVETNSARRTFDAHFFNSSTFQWVLSELDD